MCICSVITCDVSCVAKATQTVCPFDGLHQDYGLANLRCPKCHNMLVRNLYRYKFV